MQSLKVTQSHLDTTHAAQLRILQLLPDLAISPITRGALSLSNAVTQTGGHMAIASAGGRMEPQFRRGGAQHIEYSGRGGLFSSNATLGLLEELHRANISLLHVHLLEDGLAGKALAEAANIPMVMTCHELPDSSRFFARRSVRKHLAGRPIMAVSNYVANGLIDTYGLPSEAVHVVPSGLDIQDFSEDGVPSARTISLAEKWGVVEDPRRIVLIPNASSNAAWLKQMFGVIAAADMPDMIWVLVGPQGDTTPDISGMLFKSGIADRVRWVDNIDDWPAAYKLSSVVVEAPHRAQSHARAALEAQAMGRPVILSDIGAADEALLADRTGWLIPDQAPGALIAALQTVTNLDELQLAALGMAARNFVATKHSVTAMQQATMVHYQTAIRGGAVSG